MRIALSELAERFGLELVGEDREVEGVAALKQAGPREVSFLSNPRYASDLDDTRAAAVICEPRHASRVATALLTEEPYLALARVATLFASPQGSFSGVSELAYIHPEADVSDQATVYPFVFVGARTRIEAGATLFSGCYVGEDCVVGRGALCYPGAIVMAGVELGSDVILHPGAVVGSDGFGYAPGPRGLVKVPQTGGVRVEDGAEIGANACVDRGSLGRTRIGAGTKIDNLCQLAHNVEVGMHSVMAAQVGISGSTRLGNGVQLGGQVGITGHLDIGDGVQIGAQSGIMTDLPAGAGVIGSPAVPQRQFMRQQLLVQKLPEMQKRIKSLEKELAGIKALMEKGEDNA